MNNLQTEILIGSLLGDGTLRKKNRGYKDNCTFIKNQCKKDKDGNDKIDYMKWHFDNFSPYSSSIGIVKKKEGQNQYEFRTKASPVFTELEKKWYIPSNKKNKRIKIIPRDIKLTPLSLCIWFMDDGTNYPEKRQAKIYSMSFTHEEHEFLCEVIKRDMGISFKIQKYKHQYNLYIPTEYYLEFINIIKTHCIWKCFLYKHDLSKYKKQAYACGEACGRSKLKEKEVMEIFKLSNSGLKQTKIADMFNVRQSAISRILSGKRWKHTNGGVSCHA